MTWEEAQKRGASLYVSEGQIRMKRGNLTKTDFDSLRGQRDQIAATWLWSLESLPALGWQEPLAWEILRQAAWWLAGRDTITTGDGLSEAQDAVDHAWNTQDLRELVATARRWVMAVYVQQQPAAVS